MNKKFDKYFGNNIARKIYIAGIILIGIGIIIAYAYWAGYGIPIAALGIIAFFATSSFQVSDRDIDEQVASSEAVFLKNEVEGKSIRKENLILEDFSVFSGYICDSETRFKAGSDGKIRTSKYFITAICEKNKHHVVATSVFDLLSNKPANAEIITTKDADLIKVTTIPTEFPKGNLKCTLSIMRSETEEKYDFYLSDDALAEQFIAKMK